MDQLSPQDASAILDGCIEQQAAISEMMADLDARLTNITDRYVWESFTQEQRASLSRLHGNLRNARERLLPLHV